LRRRTRFCQPKQPVVKRATGQLDVSAIDFIGPEKPPGNFVDAIGLVGWDCVCCLFGHFHDNRPHCERGSQLRKVYHVYGHGEPTRKTLLDTISVHLKAKKMASACRCSVARHRNAPASPIRPMEMRSGLWYPVTLSLATNGLRQAGCPGTAILRLPDWRHPGLAGSRVSKCRLPCCS
jgi:hypothetical protein